MSQPERIFKALSDPARVRILEFLRRPEAACCSFGDRVCACDVERVLGVSQATVSHHMKLLVDAGLICAEKHGRWVFYRIEGEAFAKTSAWLASFGPQEGGAGASGCAPRQAVA